MISRPYLFLCLRLLLGALFIAASIDKIIHPADFANIIFNYQILPYNLINITAILLPWLELFLGIIIAAGILLPGAALAANLLLATFFLALVVNLLRGIDVHCGCFSTKVIGTPHTAWYIARDSFFLLLGILVLFGTFRYHASKTG